MIHINIVWSNAKISWLGVSLIVERKIKFKLLLSLSKHSKNVKSDIINSNYSIVHTGITKKDL